MSADHVLGIDGCKAGWCVCALSNSGRWSLELFSDIQSVWENYYQAKKILIDIPIGLAEKGHRTCDFEARELLGPKWASIFLTPCRDAVYANSYTEACQINFELCKRKISKQAWALTLKIKEVDEIIRADSLAMERIYESHPELCFQGLNQGNSLLFSKKQYFGIKERIRLLKPLLNNVEDIIEYGEKNFKRSQVAADDIVDATCLALCAKQIDDNMQYVPEKCETDRYNIPMRMTVPKIKT